MSNLIHILKARIAERAERRTDGEVGQSTAEYAMITAVLLLGAGASSPFFIDLINGLQAYYESVYWVIQAPFP